MAVLHRPSDESTTFLWNRLDELESLSKALSICLDNLAEEVSVSHGLLLMGGGASALASHVRSLKALKLRKYDEMVRMQEAWENVEDELAYWVKESGPEGKRIADLMTSSVVSGAGESRRGPLAPEPMMPEEEKAQTQQLKAQIGASENKIRKLRVAIADLSEENARNLSEVEKRGLSGGINLVRGLREEIREIEFELSEAKSGEATGRTKISLIQSSLQASKKGCISEGMLQDLSAPPNGHDQASIANGNDERNSQANQSTEPDQEDKTASERIVGGESTAIVLRQPGNRGYFPLGLWQIIMRIIGMGEQEQELSRSSGETSIARTAMII